MPLARRFNFQVDEDININGLSMLYNLQVLRKIFRISGADKQTYILSGEII